MSGRSPLPSVPSPLSDQLRALARNDLVSGYPLAVELIRKAADKLDRQRKIIERLILKDRKT